MIPKVDLWPPNVHMNARACPHGSADTRAPIHMYLQGKN